MKISEIFENVDYENPWTGTYVANYYSLTPKKKGTIAEKIVEEILVESGYDVQPATNPGHDRIVDGVKTEIKFGLATEANVDWQTIFNHVSIQKDWEQIIFCCVNGDLCFRMIVFDRDTLPLEFLTTQQGGKKIKNDDFMIAGKKSKQLLFNEKAKVLCYTA